PLIAAIVYHPLSAILFPYTTLFRSSKQIYPKTQYAFPRKGDFTLEIRDITASYGGPEMQYKVLVRPWVPHLGEARLSKDYVNLRSEEHTSELQSRDNLVCRLLLEKK